MKKPGKKKAVMLKIAAKRGKKNTLRKKNHTKIVAKKKRIDQDLINRQNNLDVAETTAKINQPKAEVASVVEEELPIQG